MKLKSFLICSACKEPVVNGKNGIYVWGKDMDKQPFRLVHKGSCDKSIRESGFDYQYSMEVDDVMERINNPPPMNTSEILGKAINDATGRGNGEEMYKSSKRYDGVDFGGKRWQ